MNIKLLIIKLSLLISITSYGILDKAHYFIDSAEDGDAESQYMMGVFFYNGTEGAQKNKKEAVAWYNKAAKQGHVNAQFNLGLCYDIGDGVIENDKKAVYWYNKAAKQGHAKAQNNLAGMYALGEGVKKDNIKAYAFYLNAKHNGYKVPKKIIDSLNLTHSQKEKGQELAEKLF